MGWALIKNLLTLAKNRGMAERDGEAGLSFSMRMTVYGIQKVFPSVRNVSCNDVEEWRRGTDKKLVCVVSFWGKMQIQSDGVW